MMFTNKDIADQLNMSVRGVAKKAGREGWAYSEMSIRGGKQRQYNLDDLPLDVRAEMTGRVLESDMAVDGEKDAQKIQFKTSLEETLKQSKNSRNLSALEDENNRINPRITILRAWHTFTQESGKCKSTCSALFAEIYNAGNANLPADVMAAIPSVSGPSLLRWEAQIKKEGTARLGGNYGNRKGQSKVDQNENLKQYIIGFIYQYPHADVKHIYDGLKARFSDDKTIDFPGKRSVQRWVAAWKIENAQILTAVSNPDEWKNKFMVAHGSLSDGIERLNQVWELDSTPGDIQLIDGRHSLVGIIDVYTRRLKIVVSKTSKATAVAAVLRRSLIDWGVPEIAKTDNGADYVGFHIKRSLIDLGIEQVLCPPFQPWHKPHIERAFRTFSHSLLELMPGFCGHNVAEKSALQARDSFADRLFKKNEVIEIKMNSKQLQEFCDSWVDQIYSHDQHSSLNGKTPFEMVSDYIGEVQIIESERALDILLAEAPGNHGRRTVQKKGIRIKWKGEPASHWYSAPELATHLVGRDVRVTFDPTGEMGQIFVFDDSGFVCIAECPELLGLDRQDHAVAAKTIQQRYVNQSRKAMKDAAKQANTQSAAEEILAHAAKKAGNVSMFPKPQNTYTSSGLEAAKEAVEMENREPTPSPVSDETRAKLAKEMASQKTIENLPETRQQRYLRWCALDRSVKAGIEISGNDKVFWKGYRDTSEWKSLRLMEEEFGKSEQS